MEPFIGQIMMFAGNFAPRGWAKCDGQLLPISRNNALFSLLGTTYGGDGQTTFALPDLRGRIPMNTGTGPGLRSYSRGQRSGTELVQLTVKELPAHNHAGAVKVSTAAADDDTPSTSVAIGASEIFVEAAPTQDLAPGSIDTFNTGGSRAFSVLNPSLGVNFYIALVGIFPSRS